MEQQGCADADRIVGMSDDVLALARKAVRLHALFRAREVIAA